MPREGRLYAVEVRGGAGSGEKRGGSHERPLSIIICLTYFPRLFLGTMKAKKETLIAGGAPSGTHIILTHARNNQNE